MLRNQNNEKFRKNEYEKYDKTILKTFENTMLHKLITTI
jgi:hypothetical protein